MQLMDDVSLVMLLDHRVAPRALQRRIMTHLPCGWVLLSWPRSPSLAWHVVYFCSHGVSTGFFVGVQA